MTESSFDDSNPDVLIERIQSVSTRFEAIVREMASSEGDERLGGVFALVDAAGELLAAWETGRCDPSDISRFRMNAMNKCHAMHEHGVICSGMVADPTATPPIYDGGIQLLNGWYLAFSGFPAEFDRALCMVVGKEVDLMNDLRWNAILFKGPNHALLRSILIELQFGIVFRTLERIPD